MLLSFCRWFDFFLQQKEKEAVCEKLFATEEIVTDSKQLKMKRTGHTGHDFLSFSPFPPCPGVVN